MKAKTCGVFMVMGLASAVLLTACSNGNGRESVAVEIEPSDEYSYKMFIQHSREKLKEEVKELGDVDFTKLANDKGKVKVISAIVGIEVTAQKVIDNQDVPVKYTEFNREYMKVMKGFIVSVDELPDALSSHDKGELARISGKLTKAIEEEKGLKIGE